MKRHRQGAFMQMRTFILLLGFVTIGAELARDVKPRVEKITQEGTQRLKIICIDNQKEFCKEKPAGFKFNDGCRECQCKEDDGYCKTPNCVHFVELGTEPEQYCAEILAKNLQSVSEAPVLKEVNSGEQENKKELVTESMKTEQDFGVKLLRDETKRADISSASLFQPNFDMRNPINLPSGHMDMPQAPMHQLPPPPPPHPSLSHPPNDHVNQLGPGPGPDEIQGPHEFNRGNMGDDGMHGPAPFGPPDFGAQPQDHRINDDRGHPRFEHGEEHSERRNNQFSTSPLIGEHDRHDPFHNHPPPENGEMHLPEELIPTKANVAESQSIIENWLSRQNNDRVSTHQAGRTQKTSRNKDKALNKLIDIFGNLFKNKNAQNNIKPPENNGNRKIPMNAGPFEKVPYRGPDHMFGGNGPMHGPPGDTSRHAPHGPPPMFNGPHGLEMGGEHGPMNGPNGMPRGPGGHLPMGEHHGLPDGTKPMPHQGSMDYFGPISGPRPMMGPLNDPGPVKDAAHPSNMFGQAQDARYRKNGRHAADMFGPNTGPGPLKGEGFTSNSFGPIHNGGEMRDGGPSFNKFKPMRNGGQFKDERYAGDMFGPNSGFGQMNGGQHTPNMFGPIHDGGEMRYGGPSFNEFRPMNNAEQMKGGQYTPHMFGKTDNTGQLNSGGGTYDKYRQMYDSRQMKRKGNNAGMFQRGNDVGQIDDGRHAYNMLEPMPEAGKMKYGENAFNPFGSMKDAGQMNYGGHSSNTFGLMRDNRQMGYAGPRSMFPGRTKHSKQRRGTGSPYDIFELHKQSRPSTNSQYEKNNGGQYKSIDPFVGSKRSRLHGVSSEHVRNSTNVTVAGTSRADLNETAGSDSESVSSSEESPEPLAVLPDLSPDTFILAARVLYRPTEGNSVNTPRAVLGTSGNPASHGYDSNEYDQWQVPPHYSQESMAPLHQKIRMLQRDLSKMETKYKNCENYRLRIRYALQTQLARTPNAATTLVSPFSVAVPLLISALWWNINTLI